MEFIFYILFFGLEYYIHKQTERNQKTQILIILLLIGIIVIVTWLPMMGMLDEFKNKRSRFNPLYVQGHFRENKPHIFSEIKGLYWRDIYVLFQIVFLLIYGIYNTFIRYRALEDKFLFLWLAVILIPDILVIDYYEGILKRAFKTKPVWGPTRCSVPGGSRAEKFSIVHTDYEIFSQRFASVCETYGYVLKQQYDLHAGAKILIFTRQNGKHSEMLGVIYLHVMDAKHMREMNESFEDFILKYYGDSPFGNPVHITYFICADKESQLFRSVFNCAHSRKGIRFRSLSAGMAYESDKLYICKHSGKWGEKGYKKMKKNFLCMMKQIVNISNKKVPDQVGVHGSDKDNGIRKP